MIKRLNNACEFIARYRWEIIALNVWTGIFAILFAPMMRAIIQG